MSASALPHYHTIAAVLLAAGRSSRMGTPKCLLPWGSTTVMGHLLAQWRQLGAVQSVVIRAAGDSAVEDELRRLDVSSNDIVINHDPGRGMFSSIQCAAQWTGWRGRLSHRAIVLGDQPHLSAETLRTLIAFSAAHPEKICQPAQDGHGRHPVILPPTVFEQLACSRLTTLKEFLSVNKSLVAQCPIEDPGLSLDLDRPEDYQAARGRFWPMN